MQSVSSYQQREMTSFALVWTTWALFFSSLNYSHKFNSTIVGAHFATVMSRVVKKRREVTFSDDVLSMVDEIPATFGALALRQSEYSLETSAFPIFHGGNLTLIESFDKTKFSCLTLPPTQHHSFFRNYELSCPCKVGYLLFIMEQYACLCAPRL